MSTTEAPGGGDVAVGGGATDPSLVRSKRWARAEIQKAVEAGSSGANWYEADPNQVRSRGGRGMPWQRHRERGVSSQEC